MMYILCTTGIFATEWRRLIGCLILIGHFPGKNPILSGFFAENDLQLKASYGFSPQIIGLFCRRVLHKRLYSAKETCNFTDPCKPIRQCTDNTRMNA